MKLIRFFLILLVMSIAMFANAQTVSKAKKIIIIDGYFFKEMPVGKQKISKIYMVKTASGASAAGLELSEALPENVLKYAIPVEKVPEGNLLLKKYNETKKNGNGHFAVPIGENKLNEGDKFPKFSATDVNGRTWTNADVKDKVMVLNLWFTGCGPCRREMPELSTWKDEMPDVMFFSSTYENAKTALPVLEAQKFNWIPIVNDTQFVEFVGANGYPVTIVIDKNGIVAKVEYGTSVIQRAELKEKIQSLR